MKPIVRLIRPQQWIKNAFVFIPMFFGGSLLNADALTTGILTFCAFSLLASAIYCLNDVIDVEADRKHPVKCHRPIASGAVSKSQAYLLMVLLITGSIVLTLCLGPNRWRVGAVLLGYLLLNTAYCTVLKRYAIIDVCVVAFGFVLRILAGGEATDIVLSNWLVLMTFLLTLFLSFAKRRDDVIRMKLTGEQPRANTSRYNLTFINQAITITASVTLVCYVMYTVSPEVVNRLHTHNLYLTSVFVLVGLLRYIQLAVVDGKSGDPTQVILRDRFTQLVVLGWGVSFGVLIYLL